MEYLLLYSKDDDSIEKLPSLEFKEERILQEILFKHPKLLSISLSDELIPLVKEYPLPTGSVDIICINREGKIFLVETKLSKNTDKRRAIAQLIEYATQMAFREDFDDFEAKICEKSQRKSLKELLESKFEDTETIAKSIKESFKRRDFVLVLAMDEFDESLRDMIVFLRSQYEMNIFGVVIRRFAYDVGGEEGQSANELFLIDVVGFDVPPPPPPPPPIDFIESYSKVGFGEQARIIKGTAEKFVPQVKVRETYAYLNIIIGDNLVNVLFNKNPSGDHGVWANDNKLYNELLKLGEELGFFTKVPQSEKFGKVIYFNGVEGINKVVPKIETLIRRLIDICKNYSAYE